MSMNRLSLAVFVSAVQVAQWADAAPALVNYQGYLTDAGGQPLNDVMSVTFRVWTTLDAASSTVASDLVWAEKHESVSVVDGRVNVILGNGTPVQADLTAATNGVDNLGEAFREDATYIGITLNDANNQYDPGEEISPRQQLLSVPYALNGGGSVLSGLEDDALSDPGDVGKVVEIVPGGSTLQLAQDLAAKQYYVRGIYLGDGRIQVSGTVQTYLTEVDPGVPLYLKDTPTGEIVVAAEVAASGRPFALLVGISGTDGRSVQLNFMFTQMTTNVVPPEDEDLLAGRNPGFSTNEFWFREDGGAVSEFFWGEVCTGRGTCIIPGSFKVYQIIPIPDGLLSLVAAGGAQVRYGASVLSSTTYATQVRLDFYKSAPTSGIPVGFSSDSFDFKPPGDSACFQLLNPTRVCVPHETRFIGITVWAPANETTRVDDIVLRLTQISSPADCNQPLEN